MLTFRSLHNIDLARDLIVSKVIPSDFAEFTNDYLLFARENADVKKYTAIDTTTQVLACVAQLVKIVTKHAELTDEDRDNMDELSLMIAKRLLRTEKEAQEKIQPMNKFIKKGSLVQAIVEDEVNSDSLYYIVAKVEHSEWFDGESLQKSFGFTTEKKNVWKSAVVPIYLSEGDIQMGSIKVYTDNDARYWTKSFLEVVEEKSDETNTKLAFESMDRELRTMLKKEHPRDYYVLRNTLIQTMRTPQRFSYNEYVEKLVGNYTPEDEIVDTNEVKRKLALLPGKKGFDTQFMTVPGAVNARRKLRFEPTDGIEIRVDGASEEYRNIITAGTDENQMRILKIRCTDNDTYRAFGGR